MQVNRQAWLPEGMWPDQAGSANIQFYHKPVREAVCTVSVGNDHNTLSWMEKSLNQFSVSNGNDDTTILSTDDATLRFAANPIPHSPVPPPSIQWHQTYCDQWSSASHSAPFKTPAVGSPQWDCHGGARPKNNYPAIPNPDHLNSDICKGLNLTGISPWFIARHTQDDYFKNPERVAADLNNRFVPMKSSMPEPFTGNSPWPSYRSLGNAPRSAHTRVDPPPCHVQVDPDYRGLPLETPQSSNPQYSAITRQQATALPSRPTGVNGGFLPTQTGSDHSTFSPLKTPEEAIKTTDISTTVTANPEQRVDESAFEASSPDVSLTSTSINTAFCESESDSDDSLKDLQERVEEACAMVERVLREREEREEWEGCQARIKRYEDEIRAEQKRKQQAREARELEDVESWPAQQEAVNTQIPSHCEHYRRLCRVKFECCDVFYACHRCHNLSKECSNEKVRACDATHYQCSKCKHEEKIDENSQRCSNCKARMSAYFCSLCKHFTGADKNPYHCEKCGICRIHKEKSFHCDVCNVCLDKRLENKHKCRPDSGHDECPICLEDAFSGCQILPCSHKVHRECAIAMIHNGVRHCPVCRHNLYSPAPEQN